MARIGPCIAVPGGGQNALALAAGGGGARGFAHLGIVRALREANIPIDFVGGASMGAIVCAGVAMGWDQEELDARIRKALPHAPVERIVIAPDCGMKYLPRDVAFAKMRAMVQAADIVRREQRGH